MWSWWHKMRGMKKVKLLDVCDIYQPRTISTKDFVLDGKYTVYGANGAIGKYNEFNHVDSEVLMACRGASCGAINLSEPYSWINGNAMVIKPNGKFPIMKKYLQYYMLAVNKEGIISGTAQPQITRQNMKDFEFVLCEEKEQQYIVNRIEEMLSQLDNGVETLIKVKERLGVYRQAVLRKAFEKMEGATYQVKDVCKEVKVGIVIKPAQYYTTVEQGVKAFRSANVREFHIDDFDWVYLSKDGQEKNKRTIIHTGDVLVVRSGYPGTSCVVTKEFDGCNAIDILIAVPDKDIILPEYLCAYTNSPFGKMFVEEKKRGVGQKHFNVSGYSKMKIALPDLARQKEVVSKIDSELSVCSQIVKMIEMTLQQAEALRQSILKKAFEGGL